MSYSKTEGKDKVLHVTKDDLEKPEVIDTLLGDTGKYGIVLPNGEINWDCPCLGGMPHGPCGQEFRDAFSCFHYSEADPKGADCIPAFKGMQECFEKNPELFSEYLRSDDEDGGDSIEEGEKAEGGGGGGNGEPHVAAEGSAADGSQGESGSSRSPDDQGSSVDGSPEVGGVASPEDEHIPLEIAPQE